MIRLGDLAIFKGGSAFPQHEQGADSGFVPFMKVSDLSRGTGSWLSNDAANWISEEQLNSLRPTVAPAGSTVFAKIGEGLRSERCRLLAGPSAVDNNMMAAIPTTLADPSFLYYLLKTVGLSTYAVGSALPYLRQSTLNEILVDVPSKAQQVAIGAALGSLDDKIAANTKLASTADALASTQFQKAVHGVAFSDQSFGDIAKISGGGTPSTKILEYWDGDIPWATPTDITPLQGPYLESTNRTISQAGLSACASPLYPAGSILMTSRATIGAFAVAQRPMAVNQGFIVVQPTDPALNYWVFHEMRSRVDEFVSLANGATFLELSRGNFKKFKVRLAAHNVMETFGHEAQNLHGVARNSLLENAKLAATRDTLLPLLMSGRLRVKDAEKVLEKAGV